MRTTRPRKPTQIQSTYVESWACLKCEARFITFCTGTDLFVAHRPDQIACPYCHYVGRFKHWHAELNPASRLGDYFPWPDSRNLDSEDAELLQNMLALSQPSAREYYACTDVTPWQLDQRPQPRKRIYTPQEIENLLREAQENPDVAARFSKMTKHMRRS
jgi:hypothetical protein